MKDTKRIIPMFAIYDKTGIEKYLKDQAEKGWFLKKTSQLFWTFEKRESKKVNVSVVYFPKASSFDPMPGEEQLTFQEFCEHTGWELAASDAQMQVYYSEKEDTIPIETDTQIELSNINKSVKATYVPIWILNIITVLLQMILYIYNLNIAFIRVVSSTEYLIAGLCWIAVLLIIAADVATYMKWYGKARKVAEEEGSFLDTPQNCVLFPMTFVVLYIGLSLGLVWVSESGMVLAFVFILLIIGMVVAVSLICAWLKHIKVSASANKFITILLSVVMGLVVVWAVYTVYFDVIRVADNKKLEYDTYEYKGSTYKAYKESIPLRTEELNQTEYKEYSTRCTVRESLLVKYLEAIEKPRWNALKEPKLQYKVINVKVPVIYDMCLNELLKDMAHNYGRPEPYEEGWEKHIEVDSTAWGANKAFQLVLGGEEQERYILCYDKVIVEMDLDWTPTVEQKAKVAEVLGK